jgi:hypothetical protein
LKHGGACCQSVLHSRACCSQARGTTATSRCFTVRVHVGMRRSQRTNGPWGFGRSANLEGFGEARGKMKPCLSTTYWGTGVWNGLMMLDCGVLIARRGGWCQGPMSRGVNIYRAIAAADLRALNGFSLYGPVTSSLALRLSYLIKCFGGSNVSVLQQLERFYTVDCQPGSLCVVVRARGTLPW